jgi:hypothetical protein
MLFQIPGYASKYMFFLGLVIPAVIDGFYAARPILSPALRPESNTSVKQGWALLKKSLLTFLFQREAKFPSIKRGVGVCSSPLWSASGGRGAGRFLEGLHAPLNRYECLNDFIQHNNIHFIVRGFDIPNRKEIPLRCPLVVNKDAELQKEQSYGFYCLFPLSDNELIFYSCESGDNYQRGQKRICRSNDRVMSVIMFKARNDQR